MVQLEHHAYPSMTLDFRHVVGWYLQSLLFG